MSAITQTKNINDFIKTFLSTHGVDTEVFDEWKGEETQKAVAALMKSLSPTKEKKIKDPNAPKRAKSAYLFFCNDLRSKVKEELGDDSKATEVTSELGVQWNALKAAVEKNDKKSKKEMDKYTKQAVEDKERYTTEMEDYTPPSDEELTEMVAGKKKRGSGGKSKKDPEAPKRPKSAYLFFCADKREEIKEGLDEPTPKDVMAELGSKWAELKEAAEGDDKKAKKDMTKYTKQAVDDKERYTTEMEAYTPPSSGDEEVVPKKKSPTKKSTKKVSTDDDDEDEDRPKEAVVAKKKGKSGYALYCGEFRDEVKEDNPDKSGTDITKLLAQMWKDLPEDEKEEWKVKASAE